MNRRALPDVGRVLLRADVGGLWDAVRAEALGTGSTRADGSGSDVVHSLRHTRRVSVEGIEPPPQHDDLYEGDDGLFIRCPAREFASAPQCVLSYLSGNIVVQVNFDRSAIDGWFTLKARLDDLLAATATDREATAFGQDHASAEEAPGDSGRTFQMSGSGRRICVSRSFFGGLTGPSVDKVGQFTLEVTVPDLQPADDANLWRFGVTGQIATLAVHDDVGDRWRRFVAVFRAAEWRDVQAEQVDEAFGLKHTKVVARSGRSRSLSFSELFELGDDTIMRCAPPGALIRGRCDLSVRRDGVFTTLSLPYEMRSRWQALSHRSVALLRSCP